MNSATTLPDAAPAPIRAPRLLGLYLLLIIIAAIEAFDGLSHVPILFDDMSKIPGPGAGCAGVRHRRPAALRDHHAGRARAHDLAELHALGSTTRAGFSWCLRLRDPCTDDRVSADGR